MKKLIFTLLLCSMAAVPCSGEKKMERSVERIISRMTLEEKVGQVFVIRVSQTDSLPDVHAGGIWVEERDIRSREQITDYISSYRSRNKYYPFITLDEEGGRITRVAKSPYFEDIQVPDTASTLGAAKDSARTASVAEYIAGYISEIGFNCDFAPVADVNSNPENTVIGDRSFSSDPKIVSEMVSAFLDGLHKKGVAGCIKHFPGHGDTFGDTHKGYVSIDKTWEEMKECELIPFVDNMGKTDMIMVAHITTLKATSDSLPATLSYEMITEKLRGELGYDGIVITDAMQMGAITQHYTCAESTVMSFKAGVDIILMPSDFKEAYTALLEAVKSGEISEDRLDASLRRIWRKKLQLSERK